VLLGLFIQNYDYGEDYQLIKTYFHFLAQYYIMTGSKHILPHCMICKLIHFDVCTT